MIVVPAEFAAVIAGANAPRAALGAHFHDRGHPARMALATASRSGRR